MISKFLIGIDEVGRGPVAGPVTIGAFKILESEYQKLEKEKFFTNIKDSKKLTLKKKKEWLEKFQELKKTEEADFLCLSKTASEIDKNGISNCIKNLIAEILEKLKVTQDDQIFLDGSLNAPSKFSNQETIIKGDEKIAVISCASIIAKMTRDNYMIKLENEMIKNGRPNYLFSKHKGYGTKEHLNLIKKFGLSKYHRKTFLKSLS
jgi:ribonuclease HII